MYGLPSDFSAECFLGATLESVCFTAFQVDFRFDSDALISVAQAFAIGGKLYEIPISETIALNLIGRKVTAASHSSGDIRLTFDDGSEAVFLDINDTYESYTITIEGKEIVV